jgi:hypothetical protein
MIYRLVKTSLWVVAVALLVMMAPIDQRPNRIIADGFSCLVSPAHARVGRPLTPMSYAGVARRTARRTTRRVTGYCGYYPYPPCYY